MDKHNERIERFNNLKYTTNNDVWEQYVTMSENDLYEGLDIDGALDIMEILDEFYAKIHTKLDEQGHSGNSYLLTLNLIKKFHILKDIVEHID